MTQKISSALCAYFLVYIYIPNHLFRIYASFEMKESLPQPRHKVQPGLNTLQFYGIHSIYTGEIKHNVPLAQN